MVAAAARPVAMAVRPRVAMATEVQSSWRSRGRSAEDEISKVELRLQINSFVPALSLKRAGYHMVSRT